ncbi:MAG: peptidoglycan-associated lipoprotein Pal [Pseudomonadota bacterium]|nr:peptidoglycan-associated lipoprotein Pal [Pseudomonadota bacterium]
MQNLLKIAVLSLAALLLAACATTPESEITTPSEGDSDSGWAETTGVDTDAGLSPEELAAQAMQQAQQELESLSIYFAFDSSVVASEYMQAIDAHADYLLTHDGVTVTLEGHTDERGSREYNVGLGNRRADAVKRLLIARGVAESQVTTVSFGEEKPADWGTGEVAWAKNRRVDFLYSR